MVLEHEIPSLLCDVDYSKLKSGNGLYLNPYQGEGLTENLYRKKQYNGGDAFHDGDGIFDTLGSLAKTGIDLFKEHGSTLSNLAGVVSGAANTYKAIKDIQKGNDELNEIKKIKEEIQLKNKTPKNNKISQETLDKILHSGNGIKRF